ncbi:hypothetical protein E2C01_009754 [Portunus trituberculatus]|uniref:Uncharacterized protein n=1 Tax=Portunus trituberculatus TaxID=210409 RepID=A0A5B7D6V3_PORTR|nr:hypothetical protein [Portunus trituberculatus]
MYQVSVQQDLSRARTAHFLKRLMVVRVFPIRVSTKATSLHLKIFFTRRTAVMGYNIDEKVGSCHDSKKRRYYKSLRTQRPLPRVGQVPLLIFAYLGFSLFVSGFIMTVLAYAPTDSYIMVMIQGMAVMGFLGPIVLVIGSRILIPHSSFRLIPEVGQAGCTAESVGARKNSDHNSSSTVH